MKKPILTGYLPPPGGIPKTAAMYYRHKTFINIGDIAYTYPGIMLAAGRNFAAWDFVLPPEEVNERFSQVIFFLPCRIAPPPYDEDGFSFEQWTRFVEGLKIPFVTVSESIQTSSYDYDPQFHRKLRPPVVRYLQTLADHSVTVGARGAYSAEILKNLGISNVEAVGCPSLYINGPALPSGLAAPKPFEAVQRVAVCYSNYQELAHSRIREVLAHADLHGHHYIEQSFNLLVKALHYPGRIDAADLRQAKKIFLGLDEIRALFRDDRVHYFTNYRLWRDFLGTMDFAYGARMHGLTPALQAGVPALFIAHDARVREMCEFFDLPFLAERDLPTPLDEKALYERCDYRKAMAGYPDRYRAFLDFLSRNGIEPNCDAQGRILDYWEPEPLPEVQIGETRARGSEDGAFFDLLCNLGERLPEGNAPALETRIREVAQLWYETRVKRGEPF